MIPFARMLIIVGVIMLVSGGLILIISKAGVPLGRLPGDIRLQSGNTTCLIGLGTSIFLSVLLTIILNLMFRFMNK
jgi:hypothetical protein